MAQGKDFFSNHNSNKGYTMEEAEYKLKKVKEALGGKGSKYTNFKIEQDPRGGYMVVAYYESNLGIDER